MDGDLKGKARKKNLEKEEFWTRALLARFHSASLASVSWSPPWWLEVRLSPQPRIGAVSQGLLFDPSPLLSDIQGKPDQPNPLSSLHLRTPLMCGSKWEGG